MTTRVAGIFLPDYTTVWPRPLFLVPVSAGYPSPADDYLDGKLDLNDYLIKHPAATFFVRVADDSMIEAGGEGGVSVQQGLTSFYRDFRYTTPRLHGSPPCHRLAAM